ncbi:MAG: hypothetical protein O8C66_15955 [Candidatus Methanoperedens sp.]|nr:hypothetical protein [Candidatus Methanoperedens sp.]MCZ7371989.1 hypothetical protein [Candidatus Methanoperedens sp.]
MNKQAVIGIIKKIFRYYGYSLNASDISELLAEKDSEHLFIKFDTVVNFNSIRHFSNSVQRYSGKGIIVLESIDEKTRSFALEEGLTIWDRSELESWIGRAVLVGALGEEINKEHPEVTTAKTENIFESITAPPHEVLQELVKSENEKTIRILLRSVPINIGKSDALSIAEAKIGKSKSQKLKFIPVWYYNYSFNTQKKFKSRTVDLVGDGEGYIHALTGGNSFRKCKDFQDNTFVPTQNYEIKQPIVSKKDATGKATDAIIMEHAKEIRLNEMIGDTIVFENKVFAPEPEEVTLKIDLIHIPVWEIRGLGETIEINGYDGQIIAIKAYSDAEFV